MLGGLLRGGTAGIWSSRMSAGKQVPELSCKMCTLARMYQNGGAGEVGGAAGGGLLSNAETTSLPSGGEGGGCKAGQNHLGSRGCTADTEILPSGSLG